MKKKREIVCRESSSIIKLHAGDEHFISYYSKCRKKCIYLRSIIMRIIAQR
jgi:hypothetical protein